MHFKNPLGTLMCIFQHTILANRKSYQMLSDLFHRILWKKSYSVILHHMYIPHSEWILTKLIYSFFFSLSWNFYQFQDSEKNINIYEQLDRRHAMSMKQSIYVRILRIRKTSALKLEIILGTIMGLTTSQKFFKSQWLEECTVM